MLKLEIFGYGTIEIDHLVLDYNGTIASDGKIIKGVRDLLERLSSRLEIHILTADTYGSVKKELAGVNCTLDIIGKNDQDEEKRRKVLSYGKDSVVAIGNGRNDILMLDEAALGIMVIQKDGAYAKLFNHSDIVCNNIIDALEILLNPLRINATLRR